jgi:hypothetical protein
VTEAADPHVLPASLVEYADRLLLSTGLTADAALRIAAGDLAAPPELDSVALALRAGWAQHCEEPA